MVSTAKPAENASRVPATPATIPPLPQSQASAGGGFGTGANGIALGDASGRGRGGRDGGARRNRGGRGGRGHHTSQPPNASQEPNERPPPAAPPPGLGRRGNFGARLTEDASRTQGVVKGKQAEDKLAGSEDGEDAAEAEVCFICASPVVHNAVSPCNHRTCHICALRLRALYKTKACAHCRTNAESVIFTDDAVKRFEEFQDSDFARRDDNLGIKYQTPEIFEDTVLLLRYNCPDADCDVACLGWPDLHRHVRNVHHKVLCDLCTRNKKVFTHEHELFTQAELRKHEKFGDDNPGAIDQSGFKGHPECGFCRQRFYGDDELYTHCRDKHERCHICDRRNQGGQQQYFLDYNSLEVHFRKAHFLCAEQECLDKKFVVFDSEIDLKGHQLEAHPNGLSKDARKEARRIDMSSFDYRAPQSQNDRGGRREGRGRGRGRDPNTDPIPQSTAQPLRRDELAYQRQMAIHSAQSVSTRTFGGQLTSPSTDAPAFAARAPSNRPNPETTTARVPSNLDSTPPLASLSLNAAPPTSTPSSPQTIARQHRHTYVLTRATSLLSSPSATTTFRSLVSQYQSSTISATSLIDSFFTLFPSTVSPNELGTLIKELAEIYESEAKRNDLLKAWNDWRAINEDYPALPGGASRSTQPRTGGGARVLRLKSSTQQSSRSPVSRQSSWGVNKSSASSSAATSSFPAMPTPSNTTGRTKTTSTPWVQPSSGSASGSARASPAPSRTSSAAPGPKKTNAASNNIGADAFPALPAAAKPTSTIFGYGSGAVRRDLGRGGGAATNVWNGGGSAGGSASASAAASDAEGDPSAAGGATGGGKKKGGKNKKGQTLFQWG